MDYIGALPPGGGTQIPFSLFLWAPSEMTNSAGGTWQLGQMAGRETTNATLNRPGIEPCNRR